jgi:sulfatase modifying factor 1
MKIFVIVWALLVVSLGVLGQFRVAPVEASPILPDEVYQPIVVQVEEKLKQPCPDGMIEIEGDYCPVAEEKCLTWVDKHGVASKDAIPVDGESGRCGEFVYPTKCLSDTKAHKHFCIDTYEYPNRAGEKPKSWMSWNQAKTTCESEGKRLATSDEWTFACEGPDIQPLPYLDGYHRNRTSCNVDREMPVGIHVLKVSSQSSPDGQALDSLLKPSGSMLGCVSPFGVHDLVGNIDEFVYNQNGHSNRGPFISGLKGGHLAGVRNACRPQTTAHNQSFNWWESGSRCAKDAQ